MSAMMETPRDLVQSFANIRLPEKVDAPLRQLMVRNTEGQLAADEREQLESLTELGESLSLLWARAIKVLGQKPSENNS